MSMRFGLGAALADDWAAAVSRPALLRQLIGAFVSASVGNTLFSENFERFVKRVNEQGKGVIQIQFIVVPDPPTLARARLKIIYETADGFEIARKDLDLRGPGRAPRCAPERRAHAALRRSRRPISRCSRRRARRPSACSSSSPSLARAHLERWLGSRHDYLNA